MSLYSRYQLWIHAAILIASCFLVFANGYDHAFNLDSPDGLVNNPAVRNFSNIPSYFRDPTTLTTYRANAEYRPVLQITFALNYAISGYQMWSWHLLQVLLHVICVLVLYALARRLLRRGRGDPLSTTDSLLAFGAALFFAIHPTSSGVVNYLWARSSLLVSALVLPSVLLYMRRQDRGEGTPWLAVALYALALFTKVEAIAALGVYALCEVLLTARQRPQGQGVSFLKDVGAAINVATARRLWPFLVVSAVYGIIRVQVVPDYVVEARQLPGAEQLGYLATQVTAWWHYVGRYLAPTHLIADNMRYPEYTSFLQPAVLLALAGWGLVGVACRAMYGRYPEVLFVLLSGLALISPTSSFMPLTEMVNEHRPYMPIAVASLAFILPLGHSMAALIRSGRWSKISLALSLAVLYLGLGALTWERNKVFHTTESYWVDVLEKAPSSRSHLNYGLEMMRGGRLVEARDHFREALVTGPFWHITHINLGILSDSEGHAAEAREHFDKAVEYDQYTGDSRRYRGQFLARQGEYSLARLDLEASLELALVRFPVLRSLAMTSAGLNDAPGALAYTEAIFSLDPIATENSIVEISTPFWGSPEGHASGLEYFEALDSGMFPDRWWIHDNIANLARRLGRPDRADAAAARAAELQLRD